MVRVVKLFKHGGGWAKEKGKQYLLIEPPKGNGSGKGGKTHALVADAEAIRAGKLERIVDQVLLDEVAELALVHLVRREEELFVHEVDASLDVLERRGPNHQGHRPR